MLEKSGEIMGVMLWYFKYAKIVYLTTSNDFHASVPGLDEVSRRTVNDVILQDLVLPSRVAVKKPLLTPPQVAETDFIYTYLF